MLFGEVKYFVEQLINFPTVCCSTRIFMFQGILAYFCKMTRHTKNMNSCTGFERTIGMGLTLEMQFFKKSGNVVVSEQ